MATNKEKIYTLIRDDENGFSLIKRFFNGKRFRKGIVGVEIPARNMQE